MATQQQRSASYPSCWDAGGSKSFKTHHSTEDIYAAAHLQEEAMPLMEEVTNSQETLKRLDRKERIKWPAMHDSTKWNQFDDDLENILNSALHGDVERKVRALPEIIFGLGIERFGGDESKSKSNAPAKPNRRQRKVAQIRRELRSLRSNIVKQKQEKRKDYNNLQKP